jgi:hypothetical protein
VSFLNVGAAEVIIAGDGDESYGAAELVLRDDPVVD